MRLSAASSAYQGYKPDPSFGSIAIGTLCGRVDGAAGGAVFAWLYNFLSRRFSSEGTQRRARE
jgi:hypothetical protein